MDFTKINDPAGVHALLESLRRSQAFADSANASSSSSNQTQTDSSLSTSHSPDGPHLSSESSASPSISTSTHTPSVADLLSQLQSVQAQTSPTYVHQHPPPSVHSSATYHNALPPQHTPLPYASPPIIPSGSTNDPRKPASSATSSTSVVRAKNQDPRSMTFQQALPYLATLSEDGEFVEAVNKMKDEQEKLERQLLEERKEIQKKQQERVKVAKTKASMIGAGLSKHEAEMMSTAFRKELQKFDTERALVAWDGLMAKQQMALEILAVPAMFVSNNSQDEEKQRKVMRVLEGIIGGEEEAITGS